MSAEVARATPVETVLFDLDGTLSDSAPGILDSLRYAFAEHGLEALSPEQEHALLGPPFYETLPPIIGEVRLDSVIASYRQRYSDSGMFDTVAYPGVADLVAELRQRGIRLAVATSKPEFYATRIVDHLGLAASFETICGDTLDGARCTKALVVGEALYRLGGPAPATVLMVGDRVQDVRGAAAHGIACLGAGWGYGTPAELGAARASFATPAALLAALPELLAG